MAVVFAAGERARPEWLRRHPRAWLAVVVTVCLGAFLGQLDASIVALSYRAIGAHFDAGLGVVQWVSLSYLGTLAVFLVPLGRLSDRLGRKRVYLWGFAVFGLASIGCALAPTLSALIAFRAVQGAGAAMLQANSIALVATTAPRRHLRAALGLQAAAQAVGLALGPTLGGVVVQSLGWRWIFALNVPIALAAVLAGRLFLPRTRMVGPPDAHGRLGGILRIRGVTSGLVGALGGYLVLFGPIVLVPALLIGHGTSSATAGFVVAALPIGFALAAAGCERVLPRAWGTAARARCGLAITFGGLLIGLLAGTSPAVWAGALAATGLGLGVYTPANNAQVMTAAPAGRAALTGGLVSTARAIGTAAATAFVAATLTLAPGGRAAIVLLLVVSAGVAITTRTSSIRSSVRR